MYKLFIAANSFKELRLKLLEAADNIKGPETTPFKEDEPEFNNPDFEIEEEDEFAEEVATAPQVSAPVSQDVDLDTRGVAWTPKIHSPTKSRNKDGSWRLRRNTDPKLVAKLDKPLQVLPSQETPKAVVIPKPPEVHHTQEVAPPKIPSFIGTPETGTIPVIPVVPPPPPVVAPQLSVVPHTPPVAVPEPTGKIITYEPFKVPQSTRPAHSFDTFRASLVPTLSSLVETGIVTPDYINQLKNYFGVSEIWDLSKNEAHVKEMYENFCNNGLITRID